MSRKTKSGARARREPLPKRYQGKPLPTAADRTEAYPDVRRRRERGRRCRSLAALAGRAQPIWPPLQRLHRARLLLLSSLTRVLAHPEHAVDADSASTLPSPSPAAGPPCPRCPSPAASSNSLIMISARPGEVAETGGGVHRVPWPCTAAVFVEPMAPVTTGRC